MELSGEVLVSEAEIAAGLDAMAAAITRDRLPGAPLSIVGLMDGAFMFCADLVRRLPSPLRVALVPGASPHRGGAPGGFTLPEAFPVAGCDLLLVDDILDTGRTLAAVRNRLEALGPRRIRIAVLLDKPAGRQVPLDPDYTGFRVPDRWVVGYGLDWQGLHRNLPYVTYVT
jgi:hypoxanthine phosphoribosyltransferase